MGTRVLPAAKAVPKEMLPVVDRPLIDYAVEEARAAGIEEFIFVTGRGKTAIEDHFDRALDLEALLESKGKARELAAVRRAVLDPGRLVYTRQQQPLGLGPAVWCARAVTGDEPFAVILPDDLIMAGRPCLSQLLDAHAEVGGNVVAVIDVPRDQTNRYGILDVTADDGRLAAAKGLVEKPEPAAAPSTLSIIGRYVLDPAVMRELDRQEPGQGGEIQLTDSMARTIGEVPFHGLRFDGRRFDCGNKAGYVEAILAFALAHEETGDATRELLERYAASPEASQTITHAAGLRRAGGS
jgi:UTP--glucose-1-phosphate uridylyltransferase